jgi:hypothetical protein
MEIRKVPSNWKHPKKKNGSYQPMYDKYYIDALNEWISNHTKWEDGTHPCLIGHPEYKETYPFYAMWENEPPLVDYYQLKKYSEKELTHVQMYETVSEGIPISPVFENRKDLYEWLDINN